MEYATSIRGTPKRIQFDNRRKSVSKTPVLWAYENYVMLAFSRRGKPTDNPFIESFDGSIRDECLTVNWFLSVDRAQEKIEAWHIAL